MCFFFVVLLAKGKICNIARNVYFGVQLNINKFSIEENVCFCCCCFETIAMKHFIRMQFQFHLHIGVQTNISWAFLLSAIPRYIQHRLILGSADIEQFFGRESIDVSKNFH